MKRGRAITACFMGAVLCLVALFALAGCDQSTVNIERTEALVHIRLVDQIDHKPGYIALGLTRCANGVCVVEIRKDLYPHCVTHEIRHVFEGDWHTGRETTEGCDK